MQQYVCSHWTIYYQECFVINFTRGVKPLNINVMVLKCKTKLLNNGSVCLHSYFGDNNKDLKITLHRDNIIIIGLDI